MEDVYGWSAKRSGARISISGNTKAGVHRKFCVDDIKASPEGPVATSMDGRRFRILPAEA